MPPPGYLDPVVAEIERDTVTLARRIADLATARGVHPADVLCDLAAEDPDTQFLWNSESPAWIEANAESQRNPHMIVGTGDGALELRRVQPAGRTAMPAADWWRGLGADRAEAR